MVPQREGESEGGRAREGGSVLAQGLPVSTGDWPQLSNNKQQEWVRYAPPAGSRIVAIAAVRWINK